MSKPEQILIIEPQSELRFRGPFTGFPVTSYIKLINPRNQKVYFKIKTTAPKRYCVRPNSGILKAKEVTKIAVCLQPYEFVASEKNKHKFMVQTVVAPEGDDDDFVNDVWKDVDPSQIMDYKLKCVFENPVSNSADEDAATTANSAGADSNVTDGKNKSSGDTAKSSAQPMDELEEELHSAEQEIIQLRVSESSLRQECLQLKEEVLKYRSTMEKGANVTAGRLTSGHLERNTPPLPLTSTTVIISVVMVIVGYLLGKLI
ncbi:vesicle-associated membrane protein-associated protein B isoform X2 [Fopius arisanus]|uniref:VAPA protein n=1 Tax=Fopius arisanus TaxID=64838 RepID=A0A0C9QNX3_9HYME|nr:PREDICTED: vesicle-associated membrane protein-associated protein B isoform X2 [Fopius arisanus]